MAHSFWLFKSENYISRSYPHFDFIRIFKPVLIKGKDEIAKSVLLAYCLYP